MSMTRGPLGEPDAPQPWSEAGATESVRAQPMIATGAESVLVIPDAHHRFTGAGVVVRAGEYALVNGNLTPYQSMVEDLLAVAGVFDEARIPYLLVRGNKDRPILAVDRALRKRVSQALAEAFADEPFYSKAVDKGAGIPVLVAEHGLSTKRKASAFRLYRPRIEPIGRLRYGPETAPQLELWRFGEDEIIAPHANALMRKRLPRGEAVEDAVERYGRSWRTLQHMFASLASDVDFDIDLVFSWVDGSSVEFQRQRAIRMQNHVVGEGDDSDARFRQIDELKYALRSVYLYAPWIRRVFIATDSPRPAWLADDPRVTIVRSEEFFADTSTLPTHNSHAVEAQLHHIDGLAEHFLYSNDDMFFGRPVAPELFFSPGGITKFVEAPTRIGLGETDPSRSGFENAARVNRRLLQERFGRVTTRHLEHCAAPLRRSVMTELEATFPEDFRRTASGPFRSATDISVTNSLYHYYGLMAGHAVVQTQARVKYVETTLHRALRQMQKLLERRDHDMFCLNDGSKPELSVEQRTAAVTAFLERYFPIPAPWEVRSATSAPSLDGRAGATPAPAGASSTAGLHARAD